MKRYVYLITFLVFSCSIDANKENAASDGKGVRDELVAAVEDNNADLVKSILAKGIDPNINANGHPLVRSPVVYGNLGLLKILAQEGADLGVTISNSGDARNLLELAINNGRLEIAQYLMEKGAELHLGLPFGQNDSKKELEFHSRACKKNNTHSCNYLKQIKKLNVIANAGNSLIGLSFDAINSQKLAKVEKFSPRYRSTYGVNSSGIPVNLDFCKPVNLKENLASIEGWINMYSGMFPAIPRPTVVKKMKRDLRLSYLDRRVLIYKGEPKAAEVLLTEKFQDCVGYSIKFLKHRLKRDGKIGYIWCDYTVTGEQGCPPDSMSLASLKTVADIKRMAIFRLAYESKRGFGAKQPLE